jgi:tRNA pseudouridine55 synthase
MGLSEFHGVININKPHGLTSHAVVSRVRRICNTKKVGHTGTLDPDATGVLPICIGRGTRLAEMLTVKDKKYRAGMRLGVETNTQDISGEVIAEKPVSFTAEAIISVIKSFEGEIMQIPPMFSAIKKNGKKLYELARAGIEIEREARKITIFSIDNISIKENEVKMDVSCSKGTYIRTLCHDIGKKLGCGACMSSLERMKSGIFDIENAVTLEELEANGAAGYIMPIDSFFSQYEAIFVDAAQEKRVRNGADIEYVGLDGIYRVYGENSDFLALSEIEKGVLSLKKAFYGNAPVQ